MDPLFLLLLFFDPKLLVFLLLLLAVSYAFRGPPTPRYYDPPAYKWPEIKQKPTMETDRVYSWTGEPWSPPFKKL